MEMGFAMARWLTEWGSKVVVRGEAVGVDAGLRAVFAGAAQKGKGWQPQRPQRQPNNLN